MTYHIVAAIRTPLSEEWFCHIYQSHIKYACVLWSRIGISVTESCSQGSNYATWWGHQMATFSAFTGPLCGELTWHRWIPRTKVSSKYAVSRSRYYQPKMAEGIQGKDVYSVCFSHTCTFREVFCVHLIVYSIADLVVSRVDQEVCFLREIGLYIFRHIDSNGRTGWYKRLGFIDSSGLNW